MHDIERGSAWVAARPEPPVERSAATRILHLTLLLIVLNQLAGSEFMQRPFPGEAPGWIWTLHEYAGLASLPVVAGFWIWTLVRRGETAPARLVPWFSAHRMAAVLADLRAMLQGILRGRVAEEAGGALVAAIHGGGLLAVTTMAVTGTAFFFLQGSAPARLALDIHKTVANLVWAYLFLHAGMAALHHLLGSDILARMFWSPRRRSRRFSRRMR